MNLSEDFFEKIYSMNIFQINKNFEFLGEGLGRIVYGINEDYVIKIAKDEDGDYQCSVENYIYCNCHDSLKKYLCPVLWYKPNMIVMKRALPLTHLVKTKNIDIKKIKSDDFYKDILILANQFDLLSEDVIATSSWGILDKKLVLIDYGCTTEFHKKYFNN